MWRGMSVESLITYFVSVREIPSSLCAQTEGELSKRRKSDNHYWSRLSGNWQLFLEVSTSAIVHKMFDNLPAYSKYISASPFSRYLYWAIFQEDAWVVDKRSSSLVYGHTGQILKLVIIYPWTFPQLGLRVLLAFSCTSQKQLPFDHKW